MEPNGKCLVYRDGLLRNTLTDPGGEGVSTHSMSSLARKKSC